MTITDNAGNRITIDTDSIDNTTLSIDNDVPTGLSSTSPIVNTLTGNGHTFSGVCETDALVMISSPQITGSPIIAVCAA